MKTLSRLFKQEIISIKTEPLYVHTQPGSKYPLLTVSIDINVKIKDIQKAESKNLSGYSDPIYNTEKQARSIMRYRIMNKEIDEILKSREEITKQFEDRIKHISEYRGIEVINYDIDFKIQV